MSDNIQIVQILGAPRFRHWTTPGGRETIDHSFVIQLVAADWASCAFEWWEKTDRPYLHGLPANIWTEMYGFDPEMQVFAPFNAALDAENPPPVVQLNAWPHLLVSAGGKRTLSLEIRLCELLPPPSPEALEDEDYTPPQPRQRVIRARQFLQCDPIEHRFEILANNVIEPAVEGYSPPTW